MTAQKALNGGYREALTQVKAYYKRRMSQDTTLKGYIEAFPGNLCGYARGKLNDAVREARTEASDAKRVTCFTQIGVRLDLATTFSISLAPPRAAA